MGHFSAAHWIVVGLVILILFGRGKIAETMGDFGKGIRSFKKGIAEDVPTLPPANAQPPEPRSQEQPADRSPPV